ncbi:MAG: metallophosphoesterase [Armatimonadota bacterium]|nr:metallophosphoesterase [Armatimonadota bacterium]
MAEEKTESRRTFLKRLGWGAAGLVAGGTALDIAYERHWIEVTRPRIGIPALPRAFEGFRICHLTDIHHGPYLSLESVEEMVRIASGLGPDAYVITGDLPHRHERYVAPAWHALAPLQALMGVWCVMGNHHWWQGIEAGRRAAREAGITVLDNRAVPLQRGGERLWLAGVGDLWEDEQHLGPALRSVPKSEPVILLTHNPDYADEMDDPRVKLMLAGHSHGGQVSPPLIGAIAVPCKRKYTRGLVKTEVSQIYISRGLGMSTVPFRIGSRPEIALIELTRA